MRAKGFEIKIEDGGEEYGVDYEVIKLGPFNHAGHQSSCCGISKTKAEAEAVVRAIVKALGGKIQEGKQ